MQLHCLKALFSGRVQGVGFRYTTVRLARNYQVTGYVKNLSDGRVELLAEGSTDEVQNLLSDISTAMGDNIQHLETIPTSPTGEYTSFVVEH